MTISDAFKEVVEEFVKKADALHITVEGKGVLSILRVILERYLNTDAIKEHKEVEWAKEMLEGINLLLSYI